MDLMLDLETWGTADSAVIRGVSLVMFSEKPRAEAAPWLVVDFRNCVDEQLERGRTVDRDTQKFWSRQDKLDLADQLPPCWLPPCDLPLDMSFAGCLTRVHEFFVIQTPRKCWARGIKFDFSVLAHAFADIGLKIPWHYSQLSDVRTLDDFASIRYSAHPHNPYYDCLAQIEQVQDLWRHVRIPHAGA